MPGPAGPPQLSGCNARSSLSVGPTRSRKSGLHTQGPMCYVAGLLAAKKELPAAQSSAKGLDVDWSLHAAHACMSSLLPS